MGALVRKQNVGHYISCSFVVLFQNSSVCCYIRQISSSVYFTIVCVGQHLCECTEFIILTGTVAIFGYAYNLYNMLIISLLMYLYIFQLCFSISRD